jgi:hypothetical protein
MPEGRPAGDPNYEPGIRSPESFNRIANLFRDKWSTLVSVTSFPSATISRGAPVLRLQDWPLSVHNETKNIFAAIQLVTDKHTYCFYNPATITLGELSFQTADEMPRSIIVRMPTPPLAGTLLARMRHRATQLVHS